MDRKLVLQNGMELQAKGFGSQKEVIAELVFNTSMVDVYKRQRLHCAALYQCSGTAFPQ